MKKLVLILLFLTGCGIGATYHPSRFYVKSFREGYRVCSDNGDTICFSRPLSDPTGAKDLAELLNKDMEGYWEK